MVRMYVQYVCTYVSIGMYVCVYVSMYGMCVSMYACIYVRMHVLFNYVR